ncbi:hypothetical protein ACLSY0_01870 [Avibacterium avium]|uniref:hypothetical protein n=1 Tax=Avibacterium avium TaxID=751 RepID=UPI003BF7E253
MAKSQSYYNSLPECSIINYEIIPLPEAALLWCGVEFKDISEEVKILTNISQSIYSHPYIPCLEKKTRVLNAAVNNGKLRAVREHGEGGENGDHVAYARRHFWINDLKQFIAKNYPDDRPKTIFFENELKPQIAIDEYERMSKEYQRFLAENTNLQVKINELTTSLASKDSVIRDQELAMQSLSSQLQQAKMAQNDAEERLERGRGLYADLQNKYKSLSSNGGDNINATNALYLIGEMLNVLKNTTSPAKKWTQEDIINSILQARENANRSVCGLEERKIQEYFSQANKKLKAI